MTASAANSLNQQAAPAFLIASDLHPGLDVWPQAQAQVSEVRSACAPILGFEPDLTIAPVESLLEALRDVLGRGASEIFVLPAALDFSLLQREMLGQVLAEARRWHSGVVLHHDTVEPGHPLIVAALADQVGRALARVNAAPQQSGLILAPSGHGDPASRAESYRLMRLIWEELGLGQAEVGFVRHVKPFLGHVLESSLSAGILRLLLPQAQWEIEHVGYARVILENFQQTHSPSANWIFVDPPGPHPALTSWYVQRLLQLWRQKREREASRTRSSKSVTTAAAALSKVGCGVIARVPDRHALVEALHGILPAHPPERVLIKVTWHGYATGTYTDPAALDLLLSALPSPAIILEGHTSSRNLTGADFDWETEAQLNRAWIRQQDAEYLRRTGLADVMARHKAQYVNVTEAYWDGECFASDLQLRHPELAGFVPKALLPFRGCPLLSFAKMKGPTRLGISNLFGLIPDPLRSRWHGPNITWFASVCCDLAKLYGSLFPLCGVIEGLFSAIEWNRQGLYRSRWGNYDVISNAGLITASKGLVSADILASRMQGQDVLRSAFFDVVREELGWDPAAAEQKLPMRLV